MPSIRSAKTADIPAMSALLAIAFQQDPVMCHIWPDDIQRRDRLPLYFAANLRYHHLPGGGVDIAEDAEGLVGVAVWDPPGQWEPPVADFLRSVPAILRAVGTRLPTALQLRRRLDKIHPKEPHWYMCLLATRPDLQKTGVARELLEHGVARCDERGDASYGAATRSVMRPFYRDVGYRDMGHQIKISADGPALWPMWRDAQNFAMHD